MKFINFLGWVFFAWGFNLCWMVAATYWSMGEFRAAQGLGPPLDWWMSERTFSIALLFTAALWVVIAWIMKQSKGLPPIHFAVCVLVSWAALRYDHWTGLNVY